MNKLQLTWRATIRDFFEQLLKVLQERIEKTHPHFTLGDTTDLSIDLCNFYNNPNDLNGNNLIDTIKKFLEKEDKIDQEIIETLTKQYEPNLLLL